MSWPDVRDVVGLLLFAVAIGIAATFLDPSKTTGSGQPRPIAHGREVTATPASAEPTPKGVESLQAMPAPREWTVIYVQPVPGGTDRVVERATAEMVDFSFPGPPLPGMPEDGWMLVVEGQVELPSNGRYFMAIEHEARLRVFIDGRETPHEISAGRPDRATVTFTHAGGPATVRVEATDAGGEFRLRVR